MSNIFDTSDVPGMLCAMSTIHELGHAVRARRAEMGLTQARTAALSGLSRQTINQLETGTVPDLGFNKAERLANALGLALRVDANRPAGMPQRRMTPLMRAAATTGVSYRAKLSPARLKHIVVGGKVPVAYAPHVHTLLDDAPVSLLASLAEQLDAETGIGRDVVWKHYRILAHHVKSRRELWR